VRLLNAFTSAKDLCYNWLRQYGSQPDVKDLSDRLRALDDDPSPDEVDAAFKAQGPLRGGFNRVTREFTCTNCMATVPEVIQVHEQCDAECCFIYLCPACITQMFRLVNGE
jgi:hypothetical protein